jgi:hypothetical protein
VSLPKGEECTDVLQWYEDTPDQAQVIAIDVEAIGSGKRAPSGWSDLAMLMVGVLKGWSDTVTLMIGVLLSCYFRGKGPTQNGHRYLQGWTAGGCRCQIMAIAMLSLATEAQAMRTHSMCGPRLQSAGGMAITAAAWALHWATMAAEAATTAAAEAASRAEEEAEAQAKQAADEARAKEVAQAQAEQKARERAENHILLRDPKSFERMLDDKQRIEFAEEGVTMLEKSVSRELIVKGLRLRYQIIMGDLQGEVREGRNMCRAPGTSWARTEDDQPYRWVKDKFPKSQMRRLGHGKGW